MAKKPTSPPDVLDELQLADVQPPATEEEANADEGSTSVSQEAEGQEKEEVAEDKEAPASEASEPESDAGTPEPPSDPARLAALEQSLKEEKTAREREKAGLLREVYKWRRQVQADRPAQVPQPVPRIPVEFDEQGQPYISPSQLAQFFGPQDPIQAFHQQHRRMAETVILQGDPADRSKAHQRFREAFEALDEAVRYEQITRSRETPDIDSLMDLVEEAGLTEKFTKQFPDIARDARDIEDFLQASTSLNPKRFQRVLDRISTYSRDTGGEESADSVRPKHAERMSNKPPPLRKMGAGGIPKTKSRLDALEEKSPFDWTAADRDAFVKEMEEIDEKDRLG